MLIVHYFDKINMILFHLPNSYNGFIEGQIAKKIPPTISGERYIRHYRRLALVLCNLLPRGLTKLSSKNILQSPIDRPW